MASTDKHSALAEALKNILEGGIDLSTGVVHFIDSTFSDPSPGQLQRILEDDTDCERDSVLELLLFPDESMQVELEPLLEHLKFQAEDEKPVAAGLVGKPFPLTVRFPGDRGSLTLTVSQDLAGRFIERLNISRHLNPELIQALKRYDDETIGNRIKVKIRNSRFSSSDEKIGFLSRLFEKFEPEDNDLFDCLEFSLAFLAEIGPVNDIYQALVAKKKFYFISLEKAKQMEAQLRKHNVETLRAQGKRVVMIDPSDARIKMRLIDRISRALYGKTQYFEPLHDVENSMTLDPEDDVGEIMRRLS